MCVANPRHTLTASLPGMAEEMAGTSFPRQIGEIFIWLRDSIWRSAPVGIPTSPESGEKWGTRAGAGPSRCGRLTHCSWRCGGYENTFRLMLQIFPASYPIVKRRGSAG